MTAEDNLLDATALSILRQLQGQGTTGIHGNVAAELNANDADGEQGGQAWSPPTTTPTDSPKTASPTSAPTSHPTLHGQEFILRGLIWYDRNANGVRDSNVNVEGMGNDVEYSHGVGGVTVQLVQCDGDVESENYGRQFVPPEGETENTYAATRTQGVDALGRAQIVPQMDGQNGKFNIYLEGLERYYYVQVTAPQGYLFTSGVCDTQAEEGSKWACDYDLAVDASEERRLAIQSARRVQGDDDDEEEEALGIQTGRSTTCVYVDKEGQVQAPINFGIMREGDTQAVGTTVALVLEFDDNGATTTAGRGLRRLGEMMRKARVLEEFDDGVTITTRYLLGEDDKEAIGTVTAEVLAATLDGRLADEGVELDSVIPKEVALSSSRPSGGTSSPGAGQLAVAMDIKGHYSPPPYIDFNYIVQESINRDTATIRRGLRDYNSNCRDQTSKVQEQGFREDDFNAIVGNSGFYRPGRNQGGRPANVQDSSNINNVFSTACSTNTFVPDYFETIKEVEARSSKDLNSVFGDIIYVAEDGSGLDSWAMGPVAGIAGLIVMLMGAFVFRRALGPRRVDKYSEARTKTKDIDGGDEMRRFGEAGGAMDDGSVDSAFYSDSDESDLEETEKERKMRRKRKEKAEEQRSKSGNKSKGSKKKSDQDNKEEYKLKVSNGSDDTESVGKYSTSSDEVEKKSKKSSSRRGRSKTSGGDNAKAAEDKIV